ncbi:helix-turn-helix domain-containing protein [Streptomyces sp. NPDC057638]|uniref:helix-turn-helix domain-containing protein n=1 Tax=Streptomyces sp. NPDC057638 TaxID=3346190 RepID=UPI00367A28B1
MPRWKPLPEELDPEVRNFTEQLRRLVDRSGLGIAAVSDRTGYSKTSWERYLNGRILAPKGAIVALAEVTGTNPGHLTTLWELAERAWSKAEERHNQTLEIMRITQALAALQDYEQGQGQKPGPGQGQHRAAGRTGATPPSPSPYGTSERPPETTGGGRKRSAGRGRGMAPMLVGGVCALVVVAGAVLLSDVGGGDASANAARAVPSVSAPAAAPQTGDAPSPAAGEATAGARSAAQAGVKCQGATCAGQNPDAMGCGGRYATTVASRPVGTATLQVRYSETCQAAWARITEAAVGDTVEISVNGDGTQTGRVNVATDAYTPMTAVPPGTRPTACATVAAAGDTICTNGSGA